MSGIALKLIGGVGLLVVLAGACGVGSYMVLTKLDGEGSEEGVHHRAEAPEAEGEVAVLAEEGAPGPAEAAVAEAQAEASDTGAVAEADEAEEAKELAVTERRVAKAGKRGTLSKADRKARAAQRDGSGIEGREERVPAASTKKKKKKGKSLAECARIVSSAQQSSKTEVRLSQAFLDVYIRDMSNGQNQGAALWAKDGGGKRTGVRVKALRCGPRAAGLRNKDVVTNIAGHNITSTANAYLAYNKVKKAEDGDTFNISVLRKGQPVHINYTVGPVAASGAEGAGE